MPDGQDLTLDSAAVQINQAQQMDVNSLNSMNAGNVGTLQGDTQNVSSLNASTVGNLQGNAQNVSSIDTGAVGNLGTNTQGQSQDNRPKLEGNPLAQALGGLLDKFNNVTGTIDDKVKSNPIYQIASSPDTKEGIQNIRAAMHEFADSMYIPGDASGDWKANIEYKKTEINKFKEDEKAKFINDKKNQEKVIQTFNLQDKVDKKTGEVVKTKEDQAKERLQNMTPFVSAGIKDVDKIIAVNALGGGDAEFKTKVTDVKPIIKEAAKGNLEQKVTQTRMNSFYNQSNIQAMNKIVADKMGIPQADRSNPEVAKQISEEVNKALSNGAKYIGSGAAKDPETLNRLLELERKIDQKVDMGGSIGTSKASYVANADKLIEAALKKNKSNIQLPGASKNVGVQELQKVLNTELRRRQNNK